MFRQYRSSEVYAAPAGKLPIDEKDAHVIGRAVVALPTRNLLAVNWWYVKPTAPNKAAAGLQCTTAELAQAVIEGRSLLMARM